MLAVAADEDAGAFLERMVEGGKAVTAHFGPRIAYINVLKNISVDCDCDAHGAKPTCGDIGILGSRDILAIDKAGDVANCSITEYRFGPVKGSDGGLALERYNVTAPMEAEDAPVTSEPDRKAGGA